MRRKLRSEVRKNVEVEKVIKTDLYADVCEACGRVFEMEVPPPGGFFSMNQRAAIMNGIFDGCAEKQGNMFSFTVCSFGCAHALMQGGWKRIERCKPFVAEGREIERAELFITKHRKDQAQLEKEWDEAKEWKKGAYIETYAGSPRTAP